jgi:CMP-N-acetylneuraminic acid synthetase
MTRMLLCGTARENSTRVKNKLIRPFGDTTLFDLYLRLFEDIQKTGHPFCDIVMAINKNDRVLLDKALSSNIRVVERSDLSVSEQARDFRTVFGFLEGFDVDKVVWVNACFPFLRAEIVTAISEFYLEHSDIVSLACVCERFNHFWDRFTGESINNRDGVVVTQNMNPVLEMVSHVQCWDKADAFSRNHKWGMFENHPFLYVVSDGVECLDINSELDFLVCESIYKNKVMVKGK